MIVFSKDSLRASVEAATGGRVTVLYDDKGYPSYMVRIPAFNVEDVDADLGTGLHPAFIVDGVAKSEILIGQYPALVKDGRAVSLPGVAPSSSVNYDTAVGYCTAKGVGWHLMTNWEWAAIALWCIKNGFQPRGNTNYGRAYDQTHETGVRQDGGIPGDTAGPARTLTGSGPVTWFHDQTHAGICDLVGNVEEWIGGLKLSEGQIYMPEDNDINLTDDTWPSSGVYFDSTASGSSGNVGDVILNTERANATSDKGYLCNAWAGNTSKSTAYSALPLAIQQRMMQAMIDPSFNTTDPVGRVWARNHDERLCRRGGFWTSGGHAGLAALNLCGIRTVATAFIGFRPAFVS